MPHQISSCFLNTEEMWGVPEHTSHCSSIYLLWWFRARLWKTYSHLHEKSRRYNLAWSQPENVFVAFHSLGHGVRQMIPSGLRPMELLRECTQHNLVTLCPSVTGLFLQRGKTLLLHAALYLLPHCLFASWPHCLISLGLLWRLLTFEDLRLPWDFFFF